MSNKVLAKGASLEDRLLEVDYTVLENYKPQNFAIEAINTHKFIIGGKLENKSPVAHYKVLDSFASKHKQTLVMAHRGFAKSTLFEILIEYLSIWNYLPNFGKVNFLLYVSDSIDNGVKTMRTSLEGRYNNSPYWQSVVKARFTETAWEFTNLKGETLLVRAYGAQTGIRGTRTSEDRPQLALLDDLLSDKTGKSPVEIENIENTVYAAVMQALHPKRRKIIWAGTPFNSRDPLYKAVASGAWKVEIYPVCERLPCTKEDFRGSWEDRFDYNSISEAYYDALAVGHVDLFNRELLLQIISNDNRLVATHDVRWFSKNSLLKNKGNFNFYITTDFATSEKTSADFSVVMVWALNANGDWYLVDGYCRKQTMDKNIDNLFTMVSAYKPMSVGIEVSGQQGGFLAWMRQLMIDRNIYFNFARQPNSNTDGIRPTSDKFSRFNQVVPLFKAGKVFFPEELIEDPLMVELLNELHLVSTSGIKSSHDDVLDAISMLGAISVFRPSEEPIDFQNNKHNEEYKSLWGADIAENNDSNIVSRYL